jgi:hypothetical protein
MLASSYAQAEAFSDTTTAQQAAKSYSAQTGGVGVVIYYGAENGVSADELGASFEKEIKRRRHQSRYFVVNGDHVGVGFIYHVGDWNSGLLTSEAAVAAMDDVSKRAEIQESIVFLEARMANSRAKLIEKYGENYLEEMEKRWLQDKDR